MDKKAIQKAGKKVASRLQPRGRKGNRTLSLDADNFEKLAKFCRKANIPASEIIDRKR